VAIPRSGLEGALVRARDEGWHGIGFIGTTRAASWSRVPRRGPTAVLTGQMTAAVSTESGLMGEDLDGRGLLAGILEHRPVAGLRALILGGGGAARAAAVELARAGAAHLTLASRTPLRNQALADVLTEHTGVPVVSRSWEDDLIIPPGTRLIVQATSIGQDPDDPEARVPLDLSGLAAGTIVADLPTRPTRLIRDAANLGCPTLDGLDLLARRSAALVAFWSGSSPDPAPIREALEELRDASRTTLTTGKLS
jgi:shikimate dehydrogenase